MSIYPGIPIAFACVPYTPGYREADHTCTWTWDDDGAPQVGLTASKSWTTFGTHLATVTAVCNPTQTSAQASKNLNFSFSSLSGDWLYTLKLDLSHYASNQTFTAEVQRRNLGDQINHSFQTYAKIPASMIAMLGINIQSAQQPMDLIGMQIGPDGTIYLIFNPEAVGSFNTTNSRNSITDARLYSLASVDGSNMGTWTEMASDTLPYSMGSFLTSSSGTWGGISVSAQYSYGIFPISNNLTTTTVNGPNTVNDSEILMTYEFMSPYFLDASGVPTHNKPVATESAQFVVHNGYDQLTQNYTGTVQDTLGNSATIAPSTTNYTTYAVYGVITGTLIDLKSIAFCSPYVFGWGSTFAVAKFTLDTWSTVLCSSALGTPTSTQASYLDSTGTTHPLTVPTANGYDTLVGILGVNQVGFYKKASVPSHNWLSGIWSYDQIYACKPADLTKQYSMFCVLQADGSLLHIEGPEDVTPSLWQDDTKLCDLN